MNLSQHLWLKKHVSLKTCVKPSCAALLSQITTERCGVVVESLFLTLYTVLLGVATGFVFSHSLSTSCFRIMIVPRETKTY